MHFATFATLSIAAPGVLAWGDLGHRTVGYLARKHLSDEAISLFDRILANEFNYDYSDAATWADTVTRSMPWSKPFHYISRQATSSMAHVISLTRADPKKDHPPETCEVNWPSDCPKEGCIVSAIANYVSPTDPFICLNLSADQLVRRPRLFSTLASPSSSARMPLCSSCT
jgi:hypothetical protein